MVNGAYSAQFTPMKGNQKSGRSSRGKSARLMHSPKLTSRKSRGNYDDVRSIKSKISEFEKPDSPVRENSQHIERPFISAPKMSLIEHYQKNTMAQMLSPFNNHKNYFNNPESPLAMRQTDKFAVKSSKIEPMTISIINSEKTTLA